MSLTRFVFVISVSALVTETQVTFTVGNVEVVLGKEVRVIPNLLLRSLMLCIIKAYHNVVWMFWFSSEKKTVLLFYNVPNCD